MATLKGIYKVLNSSGTYDEINLRTTADQVVESSSKRFVTDTEKTTWNNKANASHTHTSAHITDATNANTANMIVKRDASGNFSAGTITANLSGNASTATKAAQLTTARKIGRADFNGTANIELGAIAGRATISSSADTNANKFSKFARIDVSGGTYRSCSGTLEFIPTEGSSFTGELYYYFRTGSAITSTSIVLDWKTISNTSYAASVVAVKVSDGVFDLYYKPVGTWDTMSVTNVNSIGTSYMTLYSSQGYVASVTAAATSRLNNVASATTGNAATATKLQTVRTINGTNFDGSGNITTSTWGTARNITIGSSKKSVNGSADMAWSLSEIGAAPASHTHNYAGSSSAGGAANTAVKLHTARTINGVSFDGSANITITANPNAHNQNSSTINAMTGYAKATATSAISTSDSLNTAIGKLERALDDKMATHTHPYRANTWVPSWSEVTSKPTFATVATSGSYNDLSNKPTIHTINDSSTTSTTNTWSAKKINDSLAGKAASSHTHASTQITGLGTAATKNTGTAAGQIPLLDSRGKLSTSILPSVSINNTHTVETVAAALSLTCEVGDIVIITAYVQPANLEEMIISEDTQRALNSGSNTFICVNATASTFDEKFKVLMSSSDSVTHAEMTSSLNNKVDKVSGKQLSTNDYTTAEKNKLAGIATNANNYVHPSTHAATMITEDSTHRFVTDAEKSTWNGKANASHTHNSIVSRGNVTAESGTTRPAVNGISMSQAYNNSYPTPYGNVLNLKGTGDGQILVGWSGTSGAHAPVYVRSKRDNADANWSNWAQIYTTANKPTASDIGALTQSTADSRYRNKTDLVFTDTIQIVTPAT